MLQKSTEVDKAAVWVLYKMSQLMSGRCQPSFYPLDLDISFFLLAESLNMAILLDKAKRPIH